MSVLEQLQRPLYLGLDIGLDAEAATAAGRDLIEAIKPYDAGRVREVHHPAVDRFGGANARDDDPGRCSACSGPEFRRQTHATGPIAKQEKSL